jgi:hypothetical protein
MIRLIRVRCGSPFVAVVGILDHFRDGPGTVKCKMHTTMTRLGG